jgi:hypothetical protein
MEAKDQAYELTALGKPEKSSKKSAKCLTKH